jgi:hypothetical protein
LRQLISSFVLWKALMGTLYQSIAQSNSPALTAGLRRLSEEVSALLDALLHPARLVAEVEEIRKLQLQADRIEATDPARAAMLRQCAARILS